ncbi:MAG: TetR/AcrR family transcriptional regulator, partial [Gaiellaceae bacterium]
PKRARSARARATASRPLRSPRVRAAAHAPRWHRRKEQRPGEILAAALDQFVERGFAATRLEDVARRAGVTKGTMYRYFAGKTELFQAVVRGSVVPQIEAFERAIASSEGPSRELLVQFAQGWMERVYRTSISGLAKLVIAEAANFPELARFYQTEVIERAVRAVKRVIERGVERGEFRNVDVDAAAFVLRAPLILAAIWKHSMNKLESHRFDERCFVDTYLEMMLQGLLAPSSPERQHA